MLTAQELERWLVRLRDPTSKQVQHVGAECWRFGPQDILDSSQGAAEPMCAIAHGQFAVLGYLAAGRDAQHEHYLAWCKRHLPNAQVAQLLTLNDDTQATLSEIADWLEANVQVSAIEGAAI